MNISRYCRGHFYFPLGFCILYFQIFFYIFYLHIFIGPDHWLPLSLTHSLTDSCLVDFSDVPLAFKNANAKLVEVATIADVDAEKRVNDSWCRFGS